MQRFVKILKLKDVPDCIGKYKKVHDEIWPEIPAGIREAGITAMELYARENLAVMIMEAPDGVDVDSALARLADMPRQVEWEAYVSDFQQCDSSDSSADKWRIMDKIFSLDEC